MKKKNIIILIILSAFLIIAPLAYYGSTSEFVGGDDQMEEVIAEIDGNYEPWFSHIWEPPSGEIETLLFCLQAAIGAGFIGYYVGRKTQCSKQS
ncbi:MULTISPECIES: energy-coupling factor ABC transporter substrate-binding protein [Clostridium]|uniref:Cobalt transport protein CbiN n=1 Tax=Clostridium senegalense TaxID=1465809 RepID=A0A6M0H7G0_9CLOT|nr:MULTISPECIES: energy-coupling factor ABC transporter substrate-binding protein [Clostridium]NEU06234.1 energy-coupling factor ABC transporter substrate-binding protein [Clostridium senegalense]